VSTYTPIASYTLTSSQSSVVFSNIPQTYTDLVVVIRGIESTNDYNLLQFNGDNGSNYSHTELYGDGSAAYSGRGTNRTTAYIGRGQTSPNNKVLNIMNYSNTTTFKSMLHRNNSDSVGAFINLWRSTAAITSITFSRAAGTYSSGTTFNLYGIDASLSAQAKATGGDSIYRDSSYWYHVFNRSGTFIPT